ncbi:MAG: hypothetical protein J6Y93_03770 [Treponema sp.]|nr:hypothetical protein [Treponema sp.]
MKKAAGENGCLTRINGVLELAADLLLSCVLLLILPLLYVLAVLTGQIFMDIWEVRRYSCKADEKEETMPNRKLPVRRRRYTRQRNAPERKR